MKERLVDFALLIALGIIGLAIVFTLVNLGRDRTPEEAAAPAGTQTVETQAVETQTAQTEPASVVETPQAQTSGVSDMSDVEDVTPTDEPANEPAETEPAELATPVEVLPALADAADENAGDGADAGDAVASGAVADAATGGAGEEAGEAVTLVLEPLEESALSRIGFNFATGQEGACSIPLEPWQHVAVSRDLLAEYGCGAQVTVTLPEPINGREEVTATVADTMGPAAQRSVNIYVAPDEPAFDYGLLEGGNITAATSP